MNVKFIFDVDGVLCDRGQPINEKFKWFLEDWAKDKQYYLATGSHRNKTISQIGMQLATTSSGGYHCLGNSIWPPHGHEIETNYILFTDAEMDHLKAFYGHSKFDQKADWEEVINHRRGSVNYSLCKRGDSMKDRAEYMEFDKEYNERENFVYQLNTTFPRFDCYLGGACSVDIVLRGANKKQIIDLIYEANEDKIYFFCDSFDKYGIDTPLVDTLEQPFFKDIGEVYKITGGYMETWEILKSLKTE
jgi:hydroxymethylpyrimidine pyrophosphatase-like HAD family hydrolase